MKLKNILNFSFLIICSLLLSLVIFYTSVEYIAYSDNFYKRQYESYNLSEETGLEMSEIMEITNEIQSFLKSEREDFYIEDSNGVSYFNQQEHIHMVDVQNLFSLGKTLRNIFAFILLLFGIYLFFKNKHKLYTFLKYTPLVNLCIIGSIFILSILNFNMMFTLFHEVLFTNDLWLFNPNTSFLITIFPESFFVNCGITIFLIYIISMIIIKLLSLYLLKGEKNED